MRLIFAFILGAVFGASMLMIFALMASASFGDKQIGADEEVDSDDD